ncbi:MAG: hypothetical protein OXI40_17635 [Chloroflexota bacterium]|nr:hypothetical protein [Chloroflexota bacterium]
MSGTPRLRDLIYFDFDKTASIFSQLHGGLKTAMQTTDAKGQEGHLSIAQQILSLGYKRSKSESTTETFQVHHDMVDATESELQNRGMLVDLNCEFGGEIKEVHQIRQLLQERPYIRAEGKSEFQDFQMLQRLINVFLDLGTQQRMSSELVNSEVNQNAEMKLISTFVNMIVPNRLHFAVRPIEHITELVMYSNLKQECMVDRDSDNVLFHYGSQPSTKLTLFGHVTSVPESKQNRSSLFDQRVNVAQSNQTRQFFESMNQMSEGMKPFEELQSFASYPSIVVYPLAVYRSILAS